MVVAVQAGKGGGLDPSESRPPLNPPGALQVAHPCTRSSFCATAATSSAATGAHRPPPGPDRSRSAAVRSRSRARSRRSACEPTAEDQCARWE